MVQATRSLIWSFAQKGSADCTLGKVAINLISPWTIKVNGSQVEFNALTCVDTASNLVEVIRVDNKIATHVHEKFTQC